jgi:hypothetical protein
MGEPVPEKPLKFFPGSMDQKENSITITFRSFVFPADSEDPFPLGEPVPLRVSAGTEVEKLMERVFAERVDQIGMVALNGQKAGGKTPLKDGDRVDVYEILGGG